MAISESAETPRCPLDGALSPVWMETHGYRIHRCPSCCIGFVYPVPTVPPQIYDQDYFFGSTHGFGYVDYESDKQAMVGELRTICRLLSNRIGRTGKMLDVGAATGYFVEIASKEGWDAEGIELSKAAVQAGLGKGRKLSCGTIDEMPGENRFDALTFLDVLEHVPDPKATLKSAFRLLAPGGAVLVNVPDFGSIFARLMGKKWHSIIPPEHLWYFTRKSLGMILESIGFEHIEFRSPLQDVSFSVFYDRVVAIR
jgi:SAM-dependent methyltransferase